MTMPACLTRLPGLFLVLALLAFSPLRSELRAETPGPAIQGTIAAQMEAFLAEDVARAFSYASPGIQALFGTPERFGQMVRQGYPMVWRPAGTRWVGLRQEGGAWWQRVLVTDQQGEAHLLDYQMQPDGAGGWKINGVMRIGSAPGV